MSWRILRMLPRIARKGPYLVMGRSGQLTKRPRVSLSLISQGGMITLYCEEDTDAGNARIELNARSVGNISGFDIYDRRAG